ncbi:MAG: Tim44-like domain-containing protein [Gammaproteobacteria bacterium]|nr:Tim44-like domain-containing protein [Gammaproteobacteria bacterium]
MLKKFSMGLIGLGVALVSSLVMMDEAAAARFGSGRSFGSRPSYSQPYRQTPATPNSTPGQAAPHQPAQPSPAAAPAAPARSGWMGAIGGMLGGLALGGLIGSLLSGHGFGGIGFLDIIIVALLGFVIYKMFAARRRQAQAAEPMPAGGYNREPITLDNGPAVEASPAPAPMHRSSASFDTDLLSRGRTESASAATQGDANPADLTPAEGVIAAGFDREGFLNGAKTAYARLQKAWDEGDLADIRQFTTDRVFAEIQDQMRARQGNSRTEVLELNAKLLEAGEEGTERLATVYFDALLRESTSTSATPADATRAREVWYFIQPKFSRQPTWFLDGLRQVEP